LGLGVSIICVIAVLNLMQRFLSYLPVNGENQSRPNSPNDNPPTGKSLKRINKYVNVFIRGGVMDFLFSQVKNVIKLVQCNSTIKIPKPKQNNNQRGVFAALRERLDSFAKFSVRICI
jgi:hypothetical protein